MSDTALPVLRRINSTPLRDVLRGRFTGRLAWKHRLAAARLPAPVAELIVRVVKRTRLLRVGKAAAADELIAHFLDALAAGTDAAELVGRFGDERLAAGLIRGRITGRLDWKSSLAAAGLPAAAADLTARVVSRTRLYRQEKAAVADELIAHFRDGMAAGNAVEELVETFGDERVAAHLIRRAKLRGRSLALRACGAGVRATAVVVAIYAVLLLRFCISRPTPTIDYLARLNGPITQTAPNDRAWPIWRRAILASSDGMESGGRKFPDAISLTDVGYPWPDTFKWLTEHQSAVELARQAARKPALGFVLGPGGSQDDSELFPLGFDQSGALKSLGWVLLPHLSDLWNMANLLTLDSRRAAEKGDGLSAEADLMSLLGLARQLCESDGLVVTQEVAVSVDNLAISRLRHILFNYPGLLHDDALIRLAHSISGPEVAADLISLKHDRYFFADMVQRLYTDDGHGDGHMTLTGLRELNTGLALMMAGRDGFDRIDLKFDAASVVPTLTASRAEVMAEFDRFVDQEESNLHLPIRQAGVHNIESQLVALKKSPVDRIRYAIVLATMPRLLHPQALCETYLGERDGTVVGIALELYRRRHGSYPAVLSDLTPELLPAIPADRVTGEPLKYRLIDNKPVVYSVGADRIDDGGRPCYPTNLWGDQPPKVPPRGDWVLFAPPAASNDN